MSARYLIGLFSTICVLSACEKEMHQAEPEDRYNIHIGSFSLLPESVEMLPYPDRTGVIFRDSLGDTIRMSIQESNLIQSLGDHTLYHYDVYDPGDTVRYYYRSEFKHFYLAHDSLKLSFRLTLAAAPYYPEPTPEHVADVVQVWLTHPDSAWLASRVFYHILNQRSWPSDLSSVVHIDALTIYGQTFYDLLKSALPSTSDVYFNYAVGIVSFTDHEGKKWRFEQFE